MFQTVGTKAGRTRRPSANAANGQFLIDWKGQVSGANGITYVNGALTGNAAGLTLLANNGIVSNTTGIFVNLASTTTSGLIFSSGGLAANVDTGLKIGATGIQVNLASSPGLITTSGLAVSPGSAIVVGATTQVNLSTTSGLSTAGGLNVIANNGIVANSTGVWTNADAHFSYSSGALTPNTSSAWNLQDLTLGGNLSVLGTMVTINVQTLAVNDNLIEVAYNQANQGGAFADAVDMGIYGSWGNNTSTTNFYGGLARLRGSVGATPSNTQPYFVLFGANSNPTGGTITTPVAQGNTGFLQAFLSPYGLGGAFVANSSTITVTCNSTVGVAITANSLSLTTQLAVSNIAAGTDGYVLQTATGTGAAFYGTLDGGFF